MRALNAVHVVWYCYHRYLWLIDMKINKSFVSLLCCSLGVVLSSSSVVYASSAVHASQPTDITFWHAMSGPLGQEVDKITTEFNKSQSEYHVTPVYKGNYTQTLTSVIAAFRSHTQPTIAQVFEVGTGTMMGAGQSVYYPVSQLMKDNGYTFSTDDFIPAVASYYVDTKGKLASYPFNSSTAVMFYNKTAFKQAGLDPNKPPRTWSELEKDSKIIMKKTSIAHGFTTGWGSWILLENVAAIDGKPYASDENGYQPGTPQLLLNTPFFLKHLNNFKQWENEGVFVYGGRYSKAVPLFSTKQVAFYLDSSSELSTIKNIAKFNFGVAPLPYYGDVKGAPHNSLVGGASLWVLQGNNRKQYKAAAAFFNFLSQPKVQAEWVKATGYVPTTKSAWKYLKKEGYYNKHPRDEVALKSLSRDNPTPNDRGIRLRSMSQIRDNADSTLEKIWSNHMTPKQALAALVSKNDTLLKQSY